jgi:hypothetical protein
VNLDTSKLEALFVDEVDPHVNPLGVKGLGEIALVGTAPAVMVALHRPDEGLAMPFDFGLWTASFSAPA